jgi:hypothetical protein
MENTAPLGHKEVTVTDLRKLMLDELQRRNFARNTVRAYIHAVEDFSRYFPTRNALACSNSGSAHRYELFFCNPRLLGGLQKQLYRSLRSGLLLQRRFVTCTAESKSHRSRRIRRKP